MVKQLIKKNYKKHNIISIYNDEEDSCRHFTGYIGAYNDKELLIQHISPSGLYDGYIIVPRDTVYRLDCAGKYEEKIKLLYDIKKQRHQEIKIENNEILYSVLKFAKENNYIICAEFRESMVRGFIKKYNNEMIYIDVLTDFGDRDGISRIVLDEIDTFSVDTEEEQDLLLLLKQKTNYGTGRNKHTNS